MKKIVIFILAVSLTGATFAQRPGVQMKRNVNYPQRFQQGPLQGQCMMPGLSEEQREQMSELRVAYLEKVKPLQNEMGELKAKHRTFTTADNVDMKAVNTNIDQQAELFAKIRKLQAEHRQTVRENLDDEQKLFFDRRKGFRGQGVRNRGAGRGAGRGYGPCGQGFGPGQF